MPERVARVGCIVVTHDALPWLGRCLASVSEVETVVVDNGSTDGTLAFVREQFPRVTVVEQANVGLAAGWNRGVERLDREFLLVLNADAWLENGALEGLLAAADRHPGAAAIAPRLLNPDGSLQRSVRGFPTVWRIATEYLYLRKFAPASGILNAFYGAGFDHASEREVEWAMGACMLIRSSAVAAVGSFDERFFLFSEEVEWMRRAADAGRPIVFTPHARCTHVGGGAHGGSMFRENLLGQLRYLQLHGRPGGADRARRVMSAGMLLRGVLRRGAAGAEARDHARWLASGDAEMLARR